MRVMAQFKVGDVVQLKSGGPRMTVSEVDSDGVTCSWFAGTDNKIGHFPADALEAYTRPRASSGGSHGGDGPYI